MRKVQSPPPSPDPEPIGIDVDEVGPLRCGIPAPPLGSNVTNSKAQRPRSDRHRSAAPEQRLSPVPGAAPDAPGLKSPENHPECLCLPGERGKCWDLPRAASDLGWQVGATSNSPGHGLSSQGVQTAATPCDCTSHRPTRANSQVPGSCSSVGEPRVITQPRHPALAPAIARLKPGVSA